MAKRTQQSDDGAPFAELGDVLRPAVEQVRGQPIPTRSRQRALDRARRIDRQAPLRFPRLLLLAGALAASLLVGLGVRHAQQPLGSSPDSLTDIDPSPPRSPVAHLDDDLNRRNLNQMAREWNGWERVHLPAADAPLPRGVFVARRVGRRLSYARIEDNEGQSLTLREIAVQVRVEGARARTLVDHTFYNPLTAEVDGTFECPLPEGGTPSLVAASVGGAEPRPAAVLRSASLVGVVPGANTFRGRLGPVPGRSTARVQVAYDELLPIRADRMVYAYDLPTCTLDRLAVTVDVDAASAEGAVFLPKEASRREDTGRVAYTVMKGAPFAPVRASGSVVFATARRDVHEHVSSGESSNGRLYVHARTYFAGPGVTVRAVRFTGGPPADAVMVETGRSGVPEGEQVVVAGRFAEEGSVTLRLEGERDGEPFHHEVPVTITREGRLTARAWAELVARHTRTSVTGGGTVLGPRTVFRLQD